MPRTILDLPDELLETIVDHLDIATRVAASLTCRKLNKLIPTLTQEEHSSLVHLNGDNGPLYDGGGHDDVVCHNNAIRRFLDRPHDRGSARWCVACYCFQPTDDFESEKLMCRWHQGNFVCPSEIKVSTDPDVADIVEQLRRTHFDAHYIVTTAPYCVHCGSWRGCFDNYDRGTGPCNCKTCGTIDVPVFLAPYKSQTATQEAASTPSQQTPNDFDHGGSASEDKADYLRGLLGIPGVGVVSRSGKRYMPIYEAQICGSKEVRRYVLVVRLEEM